MILQHPRRCDDIADHEASPRSPERPESVLDRRNEGGEPRERDRQALSEDDFVYAPRAFLRGVAHADAGDAVAARAHYEQAHALLRVSVDAHPNDPRLHIALGLTLAGLNRQREAIAAAERAMALAPLADHVLSATAHMGSAAAGFAAAGESDGALRLLDQLLACRQGGRCRCRCCVWIPRGIRCAGIRDLTRCCGGGRGVSVAETG